MRPRFAIVAWGVVVAAADVFAGKEIDRTQTRQFITMLRGLGIDTDSAVILVAHSPASPTTQA
jgi:RecA-family ATPase